MSPRTILCLGKKGTFAIRHLLSGRLSRQWSWGRLSRIGDVGEGNRFDYHYWELSPDALLCFLLSCASPTQSGILHFGSRHLWGWWECCQWFFVIAIRSLVWLGSFHWSGCGKCTRFSCFGCLFRCCEHPLAFCGIQAEFLSKLFLLSCQCRTYRFLPPYAHNRSLPGFGLHC